MTDLLRGVRANGAVLRQSMTAPPWCWANADAAPLSLYVLLRGDAWVVPDRAEPRQLSAGDIAIVRGPHPHRVADAPDTPPQVTIHAARHCTGVTDGRPVPEAESPRLGPRLFGEAHDAPVSLVTGAYDGGGDVGRLLLDALPDVCVVPARPDGPSTALTLLTEELAVSRPGQQLVLDRLLDLLLVSAMREWFERPEARAPAWYRALGDPVAGPALRAMHRDPVRAWAVADLAAEAGVSRAAFARRFTEAVGTPPLAYLTRRRMDLAADLLRRPGTTVSAAARRVGYTNAFAFSTAFKRTHGVSPGSLVADTPEEAGTPEEPGLVTP
ncbi:AraC family transcriptional regulator [Streptomyces sp. MZ04]|uniref:AraC family transcriptional regulator n=1 Tax=Streptomyces sp. MZ04 TaxID=2559236 RepID=UPI0032AEE396